MRRSFFFLCTAAVLFAARPLDAQYVFQRNDSGQTVTNPDGSQFTFPDNNLWTQPYTTATDSQGNIYPNAYTNWTAKTSYPDGAGVSATINGSCHLNETVSFQSLTLGSAGSLAIDSGNSGGAGNHSITVTMAAGGAGKVQNAGTIVIGVAEQATTITLANTLTLSGGGIYNLTDYDTTIQGPGALAISSDATLTVTGGSVISATLSNAGILEGADSKGLVLTSATAINTGTIAARNGGGVALQNVKLNNTGGLLSVEDATSAIDLAGSAVTGGTLSSANDTGSDLSSGIFHTSAPSSLKGATLTKGSVFVVENPLTVTGTLINNGYFALYGYNFNTGQNSGLTLTGNTTFQGTGQVVLSGNSTGSNSSQIIPADANANPLPTLTNTAGHTIAGASPIMVNLNNAGLVDGNASGATLSLRGPKITNTGTLRASGGGQLALYGVVNNTGGSISAADTSSIVYLENGVAITGGTLRSIYAAPDNQTGSYIFVESGATLKDLTLATGSYLAANSGCILAGTVVNDGVINVPGGGSASTLTLTGDVTLAGSGTFLPNGYIEPADGLSTVPTLTVGSAQAVQGYGTANVSSHRDVIDVSVVNNGTMISNFLNLDLYGPSFTNNGTVAAIDNGNDFAFVEIDTDTTLTNYNATTQTLTGGTYQVIDHGHGAGIYFNSNVLVNAASILLSGSDSRMPVIYTMTDNQGSFALGNLRQFTTAADLKSEGTLILDAGCTLHVSGAFTETKAASQSAPSLQFVIGGTSSQGATSPGVLQANGAATLTGTLALSFSAGAKLPSASDTLTIISTTASIGGSFANVASGARLTTTDGLGSFVVNYGAKSATPSAVVLSGFAPAGSPTITSPTTATATVGQAFSYQITATDNPTKFGALGLFNGITINKQTGLISGTPTATGTHALTLQATNGKGTGTQILTLTIKVPKPVITSAVMATAYVGKAFSYQIAATNNPTSYGALGLFGGVTINKQTGLISGTPTAAGTHMLTLQAANAGGTGTQTFTLKVLAAPEITSKGTATATVGQPFSYQIVATNDPTSYGVLGLPPGLKVDGHTGLISGTPTKAGTFTLTLKAGNGAGSDSAMLTLTIGS